MRALLRLSSLLLACLALAQAAAAQTATYHLHVEVWPAAQRKLLPAGPDSTATWSETNVQNVPPGDVWFAWHDTSTGVPGAPGVIPAGSNFSFALWMRKTAAFGTMYAYRVTVAPMEVAMQSGLQRLPARRLNRFLCQCRHSR